MLQNDLILNQINNQCKKQLHHKLASECFTKQFYDVDYGFSKWSFSFSSGNCKNMRCIKISLQLREILTFLQLFYKLVLVSDHGNICLILQMLAILCWKLEYFITILFVVSRFSLTSMLGADRNLSFSVKSFFFRHDWTEFLFFNMGNKSHLIRISEFLS